MGELFEELLSEIKVLDPQGPFLVRWNKIFAITCVMAVSLDPLFFYIPVIKKETKCLHLDKTLQITACVLRTLFDLFYIIRIFFGFVTGYIAPSSRVFGRGELVKDLNKTMKRYLSSSFIIDLLSVLPLPQVVFRKSTYSSEVIYLLKIMVFAQYLPRFIRIHLIYKEIRWHIFGTAMWPVAASHLYAYLLASHVFGSSWYLLSVDSELKCWKHVLKNATISNHSYLSCGQHNQTIISVLNRYCILNPDEIKNAEAFDFGIHFDALASYMVESSTSFLRKLLYCFLWALCNISSFGQNLKTGTFMGEMIFVIFISIFSLVLISLLIGNLQTYLSSRIARVEEMMIRGVNIERWMSRQMLPEGLRERIRLYENYKRQQTEGFDEETLIGSLPKELGRDIKRHLCVHLLRRMPVLGSMDEQLLDGMCYKLKAVFYLENSYIVREGDPVEEMLFIMRGNLQSITTSGGRTGFSNLALLRAGDFCGEELLRWALDPRSSSHLPISIRTVKTVSEVEAFALMADDLKFVASNFRRLHSEQVKHMFRFYSHRWRTWAACFIQAVWRRYNKRKIERSLREAEDNQPDSSAIEEGSSSFGPIVYASRFATNALRPLRHRRECNTTSQRLPPLLPQKPAEPNFVTKQQ